MAADKTHFFRQISTALKGLSIGRKFSLGALVACAVVACVLLMSWASRPEYVVLYSDLEPEDAGVVLSALKERKIPFQIHATGRSVLVPQEKVHEIRMELAAQGLPQGNAVGLELFDQNRLGMTEFAQNVNYQRALQGELARTISGFSEVDSARVHLVMPQKSVFVEDDTPATASVVLKLGAGKWLNQSQVDGIVHLVSSSIMGLSPENVTVVDNFGKVLSGGEDDSGMQKTGAYQLEYKDKIEKNLENRISTMLEKALGPEKAIVRVSCLLNFKKHEKTEEMYFPENQVVRSEQMFSATNDTAEDTPSGIPGLGVSAAADPAGAEPLDGRAVYKKQDRTVNYEIGKVTSHTVEPVGNMEKISVAVLVDGTYEAGQAKKGEETWTYLARSDEELKKLEDIVKSAITFDAARGDHVSVVNLPFKTERLNGEAAEPGSGSWVDRVVQLGKPVFKYGLALLVVLFVYRILIRPMVQWVTSAQISETQLVQQLPKTVGELEREFEKGVRGLPFNERAAKLLSGNNERVVQVLRQMVNQQ